MQLASPNQMTPSTLLKENFQLRLVPKAEPAMINSYFKNGNVLCGIVSTTTLFMSKIFVPVLSMACPCRIHTVFGHHRGLTTYFHRLRVMCFGCSVNIFPLL